MFSFLLFFFLSVALSTILTFGVRRIAIHRGWLDQPALPRHRHPTPIPRLGGVAIFFAFLTVMALSFFVPDFPSPSYRFPLVVFLGVLGPALIVFAMGVYDDLRPLKGRSKFLIQVAAAVLLYLMGFGIHQLNLVFGNQFLQIFISLPLTVFWVLLITNAFNLIDGLDGLAAGSALFSTVVVFITSLALGNNPLALVTAVLAGSILGFLFFNFHPASIFLGDSGSQFIGFLLSALALMASQKAPVMVAVAIPVVAFGLPILDVVLALVRRLLNGRPLFEGDDEHIHHKLLKRGLPHRRAVLVLYLVSAAFGLLSLAMLRGQEMLAFVLSVVAIGVWIGIQYLGYLEFAEIRNFAHGIAKRRKWIVNNLEVRRTAQALRECRDLGAVCDVLDSALSRFGFSGFQLNTGLEQSISSGVLRLGNSHGKGNGSYSGLSSSSWILRLALDNPSGKPSGFLELHRNGSSEPLLLDVDLLTLELRSALSHAVFHRADEKCVSDKDAEFPAEISQLSSSDD